MSGKSAKVARGGDLSKPPFWRYNSDFRHVRWTDAGGRNQNNFGKRLTRLKEQAQKWAAGEKPT